jgi:DNA replication regulator DPB11
VFIFPYLLLTSVVIDVLSEGSNKVFMSCSGFDEAERLFMKRLLKVLGQRALILMVELLLIMIAQYLGITLLPVFSKRATHLLCPSAEGLKFDKAQEWGIPVVGMEWMEEIKRTGVIPDVDRFLVSGLHVERENDPKGKRKATGESKMADITNGIFVHPLSPYLDIDFCTITGQSQSPNQDPSLVPTQEVRQHKANSPPASPQRLKGQPLSVPSLSKLLISDEPGGSGLSQSGSFGKPNALLRSANNSKPASQEPGTPAVEESEFPEPEAAVNYLDFDTGFGEPPESVTDDSIPPETRPSTPNRPRGFPTEIAGLQDEDMQIPSSETPSPMKSVVDTTTRNSKISQSVSPSKFYPPPQPMDEEKTRALQESLSSLLGKRRSDDGTEGTESNANGRKISNRSGKRHRPLRLKVC